MKILLSAYACRPHHGSEPAVGWNWAIEIAKLGHEVYVLTRKDNRPFIESESADIQGKINFIYYDLPDIFLKVKKISGIYFYYSCWQFGAYLMLRKKFKDRFDVVHHLTYVSFRFPVFIHRLKGSFILGPVAGGEESSANLTSTLPFSAKLKEKVRMLINRLNHYNFFINQAYAKASKIIATTEETFSKIPVRYHNKTKILPAIGIAALSNGELEKHKEFTVLYAGQLLHWKGIHIALESFAKAVAKNPSLRFKIIGSGNFKSYLTNLVNKLKISDKVDFIKKLPQRELFDEYKKAHVFLFPSLHDSGGFVVIEAMSYGLPVICLDKGGPPYFVGKDSRNVIEVKDNTLDQITSKISGLLVEYSQNPELLQSQFADVRIRSKQFEWDKTVWNVYQDIEL